ncbi:MAG: tRNA dihydrouridine(20/20a) synthase DusA [Oricola sp.]|nr:tRNA dihydrouridine(20/20a) synthase DusA [Oricola sp.]
MMDWTDRHCRFFHRQLTRHTLLYTEMVVADAAIHGDRERLLGFDDAEHPVALQLGGSDPDKLAEVTRIVADFGYDEVNLNVGCPSDRVQSGTFGACLMRTPDLVARCVEAMKAAAPASLPVTVKCRIGVDDQDPEQALFGLVRQVVDAGADAIWVHARKAWLEGLSPKENRDIPPLDYDIVYRLKADYPDHFIGINGGIHELDQAHAHRAHVDGVMMGRAAYHNPGLLAQADRVMFAETATAPDLADVVGIMADYVDRHVRAGGKAHHVTRHMVGLFHGVAGARQWRQTLSTRGVLAGADGDVLRDALRNVMQAGQAAA